MTKSLIHFFEILRSAQNDIVGVGGFRRPDICYLYCPSKEQALKNLNFFLIMQHKRIIMTIECRNAFLRFDKPILSVFANSNERSFELARYSLQWV